MNTGITKTDLGWGSPNFHKMGRAKIQLIRTFLGMTDATVVISDIDTAWLRNPFPFFDRFKDADILTSTDQLGPTVKTEDLERWPQAGSAFNIGIMMFRPKSRNFVDAWIKILDQPNMWDQNAFNDLSRKGALPSRPDGLFIGFGGNLTLGILPASLFASGHVFFVQHKAEEYNLKAYVAHATFQYSGTPGKRHRFRESMFFEDPPSYYDHPKGFINLKMNLPPELLANASGQHIKGKMTAKMLYSHFNLVQHQLVQIRAGIALATLTGRVLILPPIWCELDKYWAPLDDGNIPGSHFKKPFICPMDHIFDIENCWYPDRSKQGWGPTVEWREFSFLDNPRMSAAVKNSRLVVEVCPAQGSQEGCSDGSSPAVAKNGVVKLAAQQDSSKLLASLGGLKDSHKIWDIVNPVDMWPKQLTETGGWFTDPEQHKQFIQRIKHSTASSCCLHTQPGWVWYDLLADIPHTDRFNRRFEFWHFKMGDHDQKANVRRLLGAGLDPGTFTSQGRELEKEAML